MHENTATSSQVQAGFRRGKTRVRFTLWDWCELVAVFVIGVVLMAYFYTDPGSSGDPGVPGHDAFYHIKMAAMLPEIGLVDQFPWLKFCWFTKTGQEFVSHHYGFHVLLAPFVRAGHVLAGSYLAGGRWGTAAFFGCLLAAFQAILISERVRWRWLWLIALVLLPAQFFGRHAFVRAISPSLAFMLLIILAMFRNRPILTGLIVAAYNHLYLGAVMFSPIIVGAFAASCMIGPKQDRSFPWKLVLCCAAGWWLGVLTYPYSHGMKEFLELQVFGSGLTPTVSVGQEWQPYTDVWWFATMAGPLLTIWAAATALRVRVGPHFDARETCVLLVSFVFLALTFKARRFIEYWPAFALLSAALTARPIVDWLAERLDATRGFSSPRSGEAGERTRRDTHGVLWHIALSICVLGWACLAAWLTKWDVDRFAVEWPVWSALAALYFLPIIGRVLFESSLVACNGARGVAEIADSARLTAARGGAANAPADYGNDLSIGVRTLLGLACGGVFAAVVAVLFTFVFRTRSETEPAIGHREALWAVVAGGYVLAFAAAYWRRRRANSQGPSPCSSAAPLESGTKRRLVTIGTVLLSGTSVVAVIALVGARPLADRQDDIDCQYELPAIEKMMDFLKAHSQPGDVVFTDDWDVFPVYFFYNTQNYYVVGLDPEFTNQRDPELWERYVRVTRGQVPTTSQIKKPTPDGNAISRSFRVELADIRTHFGAKFVITDRDHKALAGKLDSAEHLAELIYPCTQYKECSNEPYLVFRIRDEKETPGRRNGANEEPGILYLSTLTPLSFEQGWGELSMDHTVENNPIRLGDEIYLRGIGTHAPSRVEFDIPPGYDALEATVGIDRETNGDGSIVAGVELDGQTVYTSPIITGREAPIAVRVLLGTARRLTLVADPTPDGQRFDHVDWAMARFTKSLP